MTEERKTNQRIRMTPAATAVSLVILVIAIPLVLILLDAVITPPRMQKHKWMLTETFGTGITPPELLETTLEEMGEKLRCAGLKRASELEEHPDYWQVWNGRGIELIYARGNLHYLILTAFEDTSDWSLDSSLCFGSNRAEVLEIYGFPEWSHASSIEYLQMLDNRRYIIAMFRFDDENTLVGASCGLMYRSLLDRVVLQPSH